MNHFVLQSSPRLPDTCWYISLIMIYFGILLKDPTHKLLISQKVTKFYRQAFGLSAVGMALMVQFDASLDNLWTSTCLFKGAACIYGCTFLPCYDIYTFSFFLQRLVWASKPLNLKTTHISEQKHSTRPAGGRDGGPRRWLINRNNICSHCFSSSQQNLLPLKNLLIAIRVSLLMMSWVDSGFDLERGWEEEGRGLWGSDNRIEKVRNWLMDGDFS